MALAPVGPCLPHRRPNKAFTPPSCAISHNSERWSFSFHR
ncbi:hypothetical protein A675_00293 [Salmonella enterica subsp. enterica serovar Enteritidis str. 2009K1726]|nr:hypothetical protein A675_00293 [Salmonella enterica subsp. enterica serovar Enteritidis str. 2009K1726]EPJ04967.1 hypothetical protein A679_00880 [Salmonella enterica subsp. enterica serovar Enteritidis str. 2010K-0284]